MNQNHNPQRIVEIIKKHQKIALFHHLNPDGDTIACSYGLALALKQKFPEKEIVVVGDAKKLNAAFTYLTFKLELFVKSIDESFLAIIGDTSVPERIAYYDEFSKAKVNICFDHHHISGKLRTKYNWIDATYAASALQAIEIVRVLNIKPLEETAFFLAQGILSDTGGFTYSLANPMPPKYYSMMLESISDRRMDSYYKLSRQRNLLDLKIFKIMLSKVKVKSKVLAIVIGPRLINKYGRLNFKVKMNSIMANVKNYPVWILALAKVDGPGYSVSIRTNQFDISRVAAKYGGGGHKRASGAYAKNWLEIRKIIMDLNQLAKS